MFYFPISTFMNLWAIYIFPGSVCLFCCSQIVRPTLGIYESLTDTVHKCRNGEQGRAVLFLGIHKSDFRYSAAKMNTFLSSFLVFLPRNVLAGGGGGKAFQTTAKECGLLYIFFFHKTMKIWIMNIHVHGRSKINKKTLLTLLSFFISEFSPSNVRVCVQIIYVSTVQYGLHAYLLA
jgi:hypothetical protein